MYTCVHVYMCTCAYTHRRSLEGDPLPGFPPLSLGAAFRDQIMNERPGNLSFSIDRCAEVELRAGTIMFPKVHSVKGEREKKELHIRGKGDRGMTPPSQCFLPPPHPLLTWHHVSVTKQTALLSFPPSLPLSLFSLPLPHAPTPHSPCSPSLFVLFPWTTKGRQTRVETGDILPLSGHLTQTAPPPTQFSVWIDDASNLQTSMGRIHGCAQALQSPFISLSCARKQKTITYKHTYTFVTAVSAADRWELHELIMSAPRKCFKLYLYYRTAYFIMFDFY